MLGKQDTRICFVGDSFVDGTGDPEYLGWTGRVCDHVRKQGHDITFYNLGVRGETSADISNRWYWEVSRRLPYGCDGRVVFSFGVNDMTLENGRVRVEQPYSIINARHILGGASQHYPILMIGPAPVADDRHNFRLLFLSEQFAQLCGEMHIPYLDILTPLRESEVWMREVRGGDGSHPSSGGYAELARLVLNWPAWSNWFAKQETPQPVA